MIESPIMVIDQLFDGTPGVKLTLCSFECGYVAELRYADGTNFAVGPHDTPTETLVELVRKCRDTEPAPPSHVPCVDGDGPRGSSWAPTAPAGANGPSEPMSS